MAGRLSFSIALNLLTDNFKRGVGTFKNSLRSMQMQVATFAAALGFGGLGLSNLVSRMIETARQTNRVTTALKNVSGSTAQFVNNQSYLLELSKKYGVEINSLTSAFSKFTAAATAANMPMEQQKKIFESVSRATVAFGLSQDESNRVFMALSQMMSKGKISAEELRLQMGEQLPVALQAMARAAGVTLGELDKLLKEGKVMSADVLPKFAEELNKMIPNVNTDNLETSLNRLQNALTEGVKNSGVIDQYKRLVDSITNLVEKGAANIENVVSKVVTAITVLLASRLFGWFQKQWMISRFAAISALSKIAKESGEKFDATAKGAVRATDIIAAGGARATKAMKAIFSAAWPMLLFTAIAAVITKIQDLKREQKEAESVYRNYKKESASIGQSTDIARLKSLQQIVNDTNNSLNERQSALNEINGLLGTNYNLENNSLSKNEDINSAIKRRIALLKSAATAEYYQRKQIEAEDRTKQIEAEVKDKYGTNENFEAHANKYDSLPGIGKLFMGIFGDDKFEDASNLRKEYVNQTNVSKDAQRNVDAAIKAGYVAGKPDTPPQTPPADDKKDKAAEAIKKYKETVEGYDRQLKENLITEEEYRKAKLEATKSTLLDVVAMGNLSPAQRQFADGLKVVAKELEKVDPTEVQKVQKEYVDGITELDNLFNYGIITEEQYRKQKLDLISKTQKRIATIGQLNDAERMYLLSLNKSAEELQKKPEQEKRDDFFDYKKSKPEIAGEKLEYAKKYRDKLKEAIEGGALNLSDELNKAMDNVKTLDDALKIAQVKEDVKNFSKELNHELYGNVKGIAQGAESMARSFERLGDVFSDIDSTAWEKILSVWSALTGTVDQFFSILEMIEKWTDLTDKLAAAKQAESVIDSTTTATKVANSATETAAAIEAAAAQTAVEVASSSVKTTAATVEMAAKSTAAYAAIPFAGPALAASQIAIMNAMIASAALPKFAGGGIVAGGSGVGDKVLARVNPGEMILNAGQQNTLWGMIKNGNGIPSKIEIKVKASGRDLVGAWNNYDTYLKR